jgi:hypothetical protein
MKLLHSIRQWLRLQRAVRREMELARTTPQVVLGQRILVEQWKQAAATGRVPSFRDVGFRVFSQFEEDGILLFIFSLIGDGNRTFLDVGSGDGINSNCANLALNFGWSGLFIDGDSESIERGRQFYANHPNTWAYPPQFRHAMVTRENFDALVAESGIGPDIDLFSIDIDGNDYWVWDALERVQPRVVIVETHTEFGMRNIVVPYDPNYVYPGKHPTYHGASPVAMANLAAKKGYRLVGCNNYGFNTIYVKCGVGESLLPEVPVESVLEHPRNAEREKLFDEIKDWEYVEG